MKAEISRVVDRVIGVYMEEDYDYVVSLARSGETAERGVNTVEEEIAFIRINRLDMGLSEEDLRTASEIILQRISDIDNEIFRKYTGQGLDR